MMCLHTILLRSFIGVIVLLVVVHAMPTDPLKLKAAAPVPLGVINPPKKDLWWPLLDQTHAPWLKKIDLDPKNPEKRWECGESYDKNSEVFATDFTQKMLKAKSMVPGNSGKNNLGIFTLPHEVSEFESILGDETVLKLVDYNWAGSSCEVFALRKFAEFQKAKGQTPTFVTSGFVKFKDPPRKSGLVVMRKVPGMPLKGTKQWQEEGGQRQEMVDKVFKNIMDFDYELIQLGSFWGLNPKGKDFVAGFALAKGLIRGLNRCPNPPIMTPYSRGGVCHVVMITCIRDHGICVGFLMWVMDLGGTLPIKPISECLPRSSDERPVHGHLTDFSSGNFLVDADMNIYPIDFGAPSMYPVARIPTRSEFFLTQDAWFLKRFDYIWYTQGGKLQLTHLISPKKTLT
ncbi:hypothetical protein EV359DRAFT_66539 [Lentinula novae-zelandiae]|nr:hypothetical protein EV359DRAFT_66539 [Lentinula novae-zelandiae]